VERGIEVPQVQQVELIREKPETTVHRVVKEVPKVNMEYFERVLEVTTRVEEGMFCDSVCSSRPQRLETLTGSTRSPAPTSRTSYESLPEKSHGTSLLDEVTECLTSRTPKMVQSENLRFPHLFAGLTASGSFTSTGLASPSILEESHRKGELMRNRAGVVMLSTASGTYYCGRYLGVDSIPGSDGQCGPEDGPQCEDCLAAVVAATTVGGNTGAAPLLNFAGVPMQLGDFSEPEYDGRSTYYCGRVLGSEEIPGSDGRCGPCNGPQCNDCHRAQRQLEASLRFKLLDPHALRREGVRDNPSISLGRRPPLVRDCSPGSSAVRTPSSEACHRGLSRAHSAGAILRRDKLPSVSHTDHRTAKPPRVAPVPPLLIQRLEPASYLGLPKLSSRVLR